MPRPNPLFILLIMVSLAFLASQLLIYLLMYTSDILDELDIFRSLTMGFQSLDMNTCKNGDCSNEGKNTLCDIQTYGIFLLVCLFQKKKKVR